MGLRDRFNQFRESLETEIRIDGDGAYVARVTEPWRDDGWGADGSGDPLDMSDMTDDDLRRGREFLGLWRESEATGDRTKVHAYLMETLQANSALPEIDPLPETIQPPMPGNP